MEDSLLLLHDLLLQKGTMRFHSHLPNCCIDDYFVAYMDCGDLYLAQTSLGEVDGVKAKLMNLGIQGNFDVDDVVVDAVGDGVDVD